MFLQRSNIIVDSIVIGEAVNLMVRAISQGSTAPPFVTDMLAQEDTNLLPETCFPLWPFSNSKRFYPIVNDLQEDPPLPIIGISVLVWYLPVSFGLVIARTVVPNSVALTDRLMTL